MLRAPVEAGRPVNSTKLIALWSSGLLSDSSASSAAGARNSSPPSMRSSSSRRSRARRAARSACASGRPGTFSTRKWRSATARDLRQVRDRDDLRALGEPRAASRRPRARSCPPMPGVDLVEDHRLAARRPRRSRARSARARRPTPSRRRARTAGPRSGGRGTRPRRRPSAPGSRSRELDPELALAQADALRARRRPPRANGRRGAVARLAQLGVRARSTSRLGAPRAPPPPPRPGRAPSSSASSSRRASAARASSSS